MTTRSIACASLLLIALNSAGAAAENTGPNAGQAAAVSADAKEDFALPETVVTADRMPVPSDEVGRSIEWREREEFEALEPANLGEALQDVSGLRTVDIGGPGSPGVTPLEIRGFPSRGTQMMYNGLKLNDPTSISGTYETFIPFLTLEDVSRVEVLKGGAGVLYGSDSQSGAVNIIPLLPGEGLKGGASFEAGSYNTYTSTALFNAAGEQGGALGTFLHRTSSGLDAHGDYRNDTASLIGGYEPPDSGLTITPVLRLIDAEVDLDSAPSVDEQGDLIPNQDKENDNVQARSGLYGLIADHKAASGIESVLKAYIVDNSRRYLLDFGGSESRSLFSGDSANLDGQITFDIPQAASKLSIGASLEHQEYRTESDDLDERAQRDQLAAFVYNRAELFDRRLLLSGGGRITHISDIGDNEGTLEAAMLYRIPETGSDLHASAAQGFRAPTLFESRGTMLDFYTGEVVVVGNDDLQPEESLTADAGWRQELLTDILQSDITFFRTTAKETIFFDFEEMTHLNGADGEYQGAEVSLALLPASWCKLRGAYTNVDEADRGDGRRWPRSPQHWFSFTALAQYARMRFAAQVRYRSSQELDFFGTGERYTEDAAAVADMSASYEVNEHLSFFMRGDNIFDADYTEAGYNMPGISFYGGVRVAFAAAPAGEHNVQ